MAGAWLAVVEGFAGLRVRDGRLYLRPRLPEQWSGITFHLYFRENILSIALERTQTILTNVSGNALEIDIEDTRVFLQPNAQYAVPFAKTISHA
jgi:maltose phosphorylase